LWLKGNSKKNVSLRVSPTTIGARRYLFCCPLKTWQQQQFKNSKKRNIMALTYMTKDGYKKKMEEIAYLESVERPRISAAIAEARDKGDLSENSEYDAAKEAQGMLEMKIAKLKDLVANARIIDESKLNADEVNILSRVKIKNTSNGMSVEYTIVADSEANLREKKIGASTPIAKGLLGHKVGDIVEIRVPAGLMKFEIEEIAI
jgi:transcription elongation factor GreA